MSVYLAKVDFTRGELGPLLRARFDVGPYAAGLKSCINWLPLKEGGLRKRSGTSFIAEVKDSSKLTRLIPFVFSTQQAYVLEFGDEMFRMYANGGRVEVAEVPVEFAAPWSESDIAALDYAQSADVLYVTHGGYRTREISRSSDIVWTVAPYENADGPFLTGNKTGTSLTLANTGNIVPLMTSNGAPAGSAADSGGGTDAFKAFDRSLSTSWSIGFSGSPVWLQYTPAAPKVCVGYSITIDSDTTKAPVAWVFQGYDGAAWVDLDNRTAETGWIGSETRHYPFLNEAGYAKYKIQITSINGNETSLDIRTMTLWESADTQAEFDVTASAITGINSDEGFKETDVGRHIRVRGSDGEWRWLDIKSRTSDTVVSVVVNGPAFLTEPTTTRWRMGAWSAETGWPAHVGFFADRLALARTDTEPQGVWGSKVGDYADHGTSNPLVDDDAFDLEILSGEVNAIQWLAAGDDLLLGTTGAIRTVTSQDSNKPLSATNLKQRRHTTHGASAVRPLQIGTALIYADFHGKTLRESVYSYDVNGYVSPELTILSKHLFGSGVKEIAYAQSPDAVIWIVCNDGSLVSLTYERDQKVVAIARQEIAGSDVSVESVAVIPSEGRDEVWFVVSRTINGGTKKYIERLNQSFTDQAVEDGIFLDCALSYDVPGVPIGTVSGLDHLEGQTVSALADGMVHEGLTVSGGQITLPGGATAEKIHVGLAFEARAVTLPPGHVARDGAVYGRLMRAVSIIVDVYRSLAVRVGGSVRQEQFLHRGSGDAMDAQVPLKTGPRSVPITQSREDMGEITIVSDQPLPALLRGLNIKHEIEP